MSDVIQIHDVIQMWDVLFRHSMRVFTIHYSTNFDIEKTRTKGIACVAYSRYIVRINEIYRLILIGLYRENAIAIQNESGDSNGGNAQYVTMRITFNIPEFTRNERNSHCDVLHITPVRVARLVLDDAIAAIQTSR